MKDWSKHIWKLDGSDNAAIREFLSDPENVQKCNVCPYKMAHASGLPCGQQNCLVEVTCFR